MSARAIAAVCALLSLCAPAPGHAQQPGRKPEARREEPKKDGQKQDGQKKDDAKAEAKPDAKPEEPPAPYEEPMLRLAENLGALTFLRDLCGAGDGAQWRERMQLLLESEGASEGRRARLAGAFNRGFQDYAASYRFCTPNAELALSRRLAEGGKLARDLAARWGG